MDTGLERAVFRFLANTPDEALDELQVALEKNSRKLIKHRYRDRNGGECLLQFVGNRHDDFKNLESPGISLSRLLGNQRIEDAWDTSPRFAKQFLVMIQNEQFYRSFDSLPEACKLRTKPVTTQNCLETAT